MYFNVKEDTYKKNSKLTGSGASVHRSFFHACFRCKCRNHRFGAFKSNPFAKTGDEKGNVTGIIIQNCEFGYGCGTVSAYGFQTEGEVQDYIGIQFDGLYNFVDATIRNNYIHDANGTAIGYNTFVQNSGKILLGFAVQNLFWNAESVSMEQFQTRMNSSTDSVYLKF